MRHNNIFFMKKRGMINWPKLSTKISFFICSSVDILCYQFIKPFLTDGLVHPNYLDYSNSKFRGSGEFFILIVFCIEILVCCI